MQRNLVMTPTVCQMCIRDRPTTVTKLDYTGELLHEISRHNLKLRWYLDTTTRSRHCNPHTRTRGGTHSEKLVSVGGVNKMGMVGGPVRSPRFILGNSVRDRYGRTKGRRWSMRRPLSDPHPPHGGIATHIKTLA